MIIIPIPIQNSEGAAWGYIIGWIFCGIVGCFLFPWQFAAFWFGVPLALFAAILILAFFVTEVIPLIWDLITYRTPKGDNQSWSD